MAKAEETPNPVVSDSNQALSDVVHQFQQPKANLPVVSTDRQEIGAQYQEEEQQPRQLSATTSNDEIQELLVSVLDELCSIKSALFSAIDVEEIDDRKDPVPERPVVEKKQREENIDFAHCF